MPKNNLPPAIPTEQITDQPSYTEGLDGATDEEIVQWLESYRTEAEYARLSGPNSRDLTWLMNLDLYWNRFDFSKKAQWQAREVMPELPQYVDRFAAALRTALISSERFFTVKSLDDEEGDLCKVIHKVISCVLRRVGRSPSGHAVDFLNVFEEIMKFGALMMNVALVTWKVDSDGRGYTSVEPFDPYNFWFDPTGRGLYRIARSEIDMHELQGLAELRDSKGLPLYKREAIDRCTASVVALMRAEREKRTGTGQWVTSNRRPVVLHTYYCTLLDNEGRTRGRNVLCVVANNQFLIRGPEENPFWHGKDWMIAAPTLTVPLAPYGKSYVENFATIAKTFNEMTNLLLDATFISSMKAFACQPSMLEDPTQIDEGVYPNVVFRLNEAGVVADFLKEIDLGQLKPESFQIWTTLKKELQEGAAFNDISLGQLAPRARTSATEIGTADQNSASLIKSIASNIETLFLEPLLDLIWKTTIQHLSKDDKEIEQAVGPEWFQALLASKKQFAEYRFTFQCRGISSLILKQQKLQALLQLMQIVGQSPILAQPFFEEVSPQKIIGLLFDCLDVDRDDLTLSPREKMMQEMQQQQDQQQMQDQQAQQQQQQDQRQMQMNAQQAHLDEQKHGRDMQKIMLQGRLRAQQAAQRPARGPGPAGPQPTRGPGGGQRVPAGGNPAAARVQLPMGAGGPALGGAA